MYYETYDSICKMSQWGAGRGRAHRVIHKIVKNVQSLKCHHVKRISPTGFMSQKKRAPTYGVPPHKCCFECGGYIHII